MVREVVQHRDVPPDAHHLEPALDALEAPQAGGKLRCAETDMAAHGNGRQRVPDVVQPEQRRFEPPELARRLDCTSKRVTPSACVMPVACQVASSPVPNVSTGLTALGRRASGMGTVRAEQQKAVPRHEVDEATERQPDRVEIGVDVGVVELDVVDDGDVRQVLQELRRLVEVGAVVFVALDHEIAARAEPVARPASPKFSAMPPTSTVGSSLPCVSSHPVSDVVVVLPCVPARTIDRDPQRKWSRTTSGSEQYRIFFSSTVSSSGLPREIALPTTTRSMSEVMCSAENTRHGPDAFRLEKVAHRRVDVLIGAAHVVAPLLQQRRGGGHRGPADRR